MLHFSYANVCSGAGVFSVAALTFTFHLQMQVQVQHLCFMRYVVVGSGAGSEVGSDAVSIAGSVAGIGCSFRCRCSTYVSVQSCSYMVRDFCSDCFSLFFERIFGKICGRIF